MKTFNRIMKATLCACMLLCGIVLTATNKVSAEEPSVEPYAMIQTVPVSKSISITRTLLGNEVTFTTKLTGSYQYINNGSSIYIDNVDLVFQKVNTNNEAFEGRITKVTKLVNSNSVTVQYTLQYRLKDNTTWTDVVTDTIEV